MAITQSLVRVYEDSLKQTLVGSWAGQSPNWTTIGVDDLDEGKEYYATAQVTVDGIQSAESAVYRFYTLPNVTYFSQPSASEGTISTQLTGVTEDVTISYYGLQYATNSSFSPMVEYQQVQGGVDIHGLSENTTYWVRPFVIDQFNRKWVNTDAVATATTPYAKPVVSWTGMAAVGVDTYQCQVTVTSTAPITAVTVYYGEVGGSTSSYNLLAQTGTQNVSLTGLTPNTSYTVYVRATNSAGYTNSSTSTFTTGTAQMAVEITQSSVNNTTNVISATSRATYDNTITLVSNDLELWDNNSHTGSAIERMQGSTDTYANNFSHADPDETYYVFGHVTYTIGSDPTLLEAWSSPVTVQTYSLLSFGQIQTTNTGATIPYSVSGTPISDEVAYSADGSTWTSIPVTTLSGGTLTLSGLTANTTYQLRGRCQSSAGWQGYVSTTFTTTNVLPIVVVDSVTNITPTEATVNLTIS